MYKYTFTKQITSDLLKEEIKAQLSNLSYISTLETLVDIVFSTELTSEQQDVLSSIVQSHVVRTFPSYVTPRQMKKAMALTNKLSSIEEFIASLPEPQKTLVTIEFKESNEFQRDNPLLISMASQLGMTAAQIDELFSFASTL